MAKPKVDGALVRYDAACHAIAQAKAVDEVKHIRDQAIAMRAYAKQAKNRQLELDAAEIRLRAERRVGELMAAQRDTVGLKTGAKQLQPGPGRGNKTIGSKRVPIVLDPRPSLADAGIDKHLADRARKLAAMPQASFDDLVANIRTVSEPARFVAHKSESPEHYTPQTFLEAVREVFNGVIDLDPCAEEKTRPNVKATLHYTIEDNGLEKPWSGTVFMNPPYGREIADWIAKLRKEWTRGECDAIIALLPARTDTEWFEMLTVDTDDAVICFLRGRLTFIGNNDPAPFPSMAVYFGARHDVFASVFGELGSLWQRPSQPREWFVDHS